MIQSQKAAAKKSTTMSKSLNNQLASCRTALERAQMRQASCQSAVDEVTNSLQQSKGDAAQREKELREFEAEALDSLKASTQSLARMLTDMKLSPVIPQATLATAE